MNWFKKQYLRHKRGSIRVELEEILQKGKHRSTWSHPYQGAHSFYDYLHEKDQLRYSELATLDFKISQALGDEDSPYFVKHRDPMRNEDNSPKAFLTVSHNASVKTPMIPDTLPDKEKQKEIHRFTRDEEFEAGLKQYKEEHPDEWWAKSYIDRLTESEKQNNQ